jgi:TetR/AcrR family transcriptional regulator, transcriptional repressor for nem operon
VTAVRGAARSKLLEAAVDVIRAKGLNATTVDDLCAVAGVTKGAFFHHFESKESLAVAAANYWATTTAEVFAAASYHLAPTAAERILAYLDLRAAMVEGPLAAFTCLAGTMAQEVYGTNPAVRAACGASILDHARTLEADLAQAQIDAGNVTPGGGPAVDPGALARHTQAVLQGAFVVAKATDDPSVVLDSLAHLRRYLECLFRPAP